MSQQSISLLALTVTATAALTAHRFVTSAGAVPSAGAAALGVSRSDAAQGDRAPVDVIGTAIVEAGEAISAGAYIAVGSNGKAAVYEDGDVCVGQALEAASGDGVRFEMLLIQSPPLQVISGG